MPFTSTSIQTAPYTPNGVTSQFPFFFPALSEDEIQVVMVAGDGTETLLTEGFDVVGVGEPSGGYIQFVTAPVNDGRQLVVRAAPTFAQNMDFDNQGPYNPSEINKALDRLHQLAIWLRDFGGLGSGGEGGVGTVTWGSVQGKPLTFTPSAHAHAAADITSGTLDAARIPTLDASKIGTGTLATARIPNLDASKITSGVIDPARLPVQSGGVVSPGAIADLTAPQQALIVEGTLVTTSDGRQWRYAGAGSKVLEASYVELTTGATWAGLSGKPPELTSLEALTLTADTLPYGSGADTLSLTAFTATGRALVGMASQVAAIAYTSPLTTKGDLYGYGAAPGRLPVGTNGQVLTADSAQALGVKWATPTGGSDTANMPNFTTVFSGNGDGVTNNDAAFAAAEGSAYAYIWLPEGRYLTTLTTASLTKRYIGPGTIFRGTGNAGSYPNYSRYSADVHPTVDSLTPYGLSEDNTFGTTEYFTVDAGTRRGFDRYLGTPGFPTYFWAPSTGHFIRFFNGGGWSGFSALTTAAITAGVTTSVPIAGGTGGGWQVGDEIGFTSAMDGNVTETRVVTSIAGGSVSWTTPLSNSYPSGTTITHGYRTMQASYITIVNHTGKGDAYVHTARMFVNSTLLDSQTAFQHGATGGLFGGEIVLQKNGNYGTGWEAVYSDDNGAADGALVGRVDSYIRKNDGGARGVMWLHDYAKMDGGGVGYAALGLKKLDGLYVSAVGARTGLDVTNSRFSVAAVALPIEQKIAFNAQIVAPGPSNGNGYVATTDGGIYVWATVVSGVNTLEFQNGSYRLRLQANGGLTTNAAITAGSTGSFAGNLTSTGGYVYGVGGIAAGEGQRIGFDGPGGDTYLIFNGTTISMVKNGVQVASW